MGCCLSSSTPPPLSSGTSSSDVKSPDPVKPDVNKPTKPVPDPPVKPVTELQENPSVEKAKPIIPDKVEKEEENVLSKTKTESEEAASKPVVVVRTSSCTKEEVDAILIQCGKLSRSNSPAKTRRYSGSKRSFDFDQKNERTHGGGGGGDVEEEGRKQTPQRNRGVERVNNNGSPRERRRRTPSRERERGGGSRRVSRSPAKRSEDHRGSLVISSNIKFVTVPATDPSSKRVNTTVVKRSIGEACRTAASPARAGMSNVQPPREKSQSPYRRRKPLGGIDQNATKGDKNKKMIMIKRENESAKPQVTMSRSRSLRKSRDFDFSPESLLLSQSKEEDDKSSYTALLLKDIKNFHGGKSNGSDDDEEEDPFSLLPSCVTKACSIVEAVADLNSTTSGLNQFRFTSSTVKKAEPRFEKYVTVKRGGCSLEEQESSSCASNNLT